MLGETPSASAFPSPSPSSSSSLTVAVAQFTVGPDPDGNLDAIAGYARAAADAGARIMLLPEGLIARDPAGGERFTAAHAQPLDGPFVTGLREVSRETEVALMGTVHVPEPLGEPGDGGTESGPGLTCRRVSNVFLVIDGGEIVARYRKLHLYDAFNVRESYQVRPGGELPPVVTIDGWRIGVMTCYDVRFPETARSLAVRGADAIAVSAAWVRGADKERHWALMTAARALENTCYVMACSEASVSNIGCSRVIGPLGETLAQADGARPGMIIADLRRDALDEARRALPVLANRRFADPALR